MAPTKRQGYTLLEMMVVTGIIALLAALIAPSYVSIRDNQQRRAFYTSLVDLAGTAREMAISRHATTYLQVDTSLNRVDLKQEVNDSTYQSLDGASGSTSSNSSESSDNPQSNIGTAPNDRSNDKVQLNLPLASGLQFGNFQLAGDSSDSAGWKLEFYPDGTSEGGAMEVTERGVVHSLVVTPHGGVRLDDGNIPDTSQDRWIAGSYVQRQQ